MNLQAIEQDVPEKQAHFIYPFFSIYLGWITVATIANVTTVLVDLGWKGSAMGESAWTIVMIAIAIGIGLYFLIFKRNFPYTLVIVWALYGIYLKRASAEVAEAGIILTTQIGMALCVASMSYLFFNKFMNPNQ